MKGHYRIVYLLLSDSIIDPNFVPPDKVYLVENNSSYWPNFCNLPLTGEEAKAMLAMLRIIFKGGKYQSNTIKFKVEDICNSRLMDW